MLTYLNGYGKRVEVENQEDIKKWHEINKVIETLDDKDFEEFYPIIGDYVWYGGRANANKARAKAKKLGLTLDEVSLWYCLEEF